MKLSLVSAALLFGVAGPHALAEETQRIEPSTCYLSSSWGIGQVTCTDENNNPAPLVPAEVEVISSRDQESNSNSEVRLTITGITSHDKVWGTYSLKGDDGQILLVDIRPVTSVAEVRRGGGGGYRGGGARMQGGYRGGRGGYAYRGGGVYRRGYGYGGAAAGAIVGGAAAAAASSYYGSNYCDPNYQDCGYYGSGYYAPGVVGGAAVGAGVAAARRGGAYYRGGGYRGGGAHVAHRGGARGGGGRRR